MTPCLRFRSLPAGSFLPTIDKTFHILSVGISTVADGFNAVAVGIEQEGSIIVGVIVAQAGCAEVEAAVGQAGSPKCLHGGARRRLEAVVAARRIVRSGTEAH